jgi:hypothetical protein
MRDGVDVDPFPQRERWLDAVGQRPATRKAHELGRFISATTCSISGITSRASVETTLCTCRLDDMLVLPLCSGEQPASVRRKRIASAFHTAGP